MDTAVGYLMSGEGVVVAVVVAVDALVPATSRAVKKPSRRYADQDWFCQGEAVDSPSTCNTPLAP